RHAKGGETAAAVASAIGHIGVDAEIVPAGGKAAPIAQPGGLQQRVHLRCPDKGKAATADRLGDYGAGFGHQRILDPMPVLCGRAGWISTPSGLGSGAAS